MQLIFIILAIALSEAVAQYFIKKYHELPIPIYYILGVAFYACVAFLLHKCYDYTSMGMTQVLWSGVSVIAILMVGGIFFGEKIETHEWIGILFILTGVSITQLK